MRTLILACLVAGGCAEGSSVAVSDGSFGVDVDMGGDCAPQTSAQVVELSLEQPVVELPFADPCGVGASVRLDDPARAFIALADGVGEDSFTVQVELVTAEPDTYEAQLFVGPEHEQAVIELIAVIEEGQ